MIFAVFCSNFGFHEVPHSIQSLTALTSLGLINREPVCGWPGGAEPPANMAIPIGNLMRLTRLVHVQLDWRLQVSYSLFSSQSLIAFRLLYGHLSVLC